MTQGEICNVSVPHSVNVSMIPNNDRMFGRFMPVLWEKDHMYESQRLYTSNKAVIQATLKGSQAQQMLCLRANQQQQKHIPLLGGKEFYHPSSNSYNCEPTVMKTTHYSPTYITQTPPVQPMSFKGANVVMLKKITEQIQTRPIKRSVVNKDRRVMKFQCSSSTVAYKVSQTNPLKTKTQNTVDSQKRLVRKSNPNDVILAPGTAYAHYSGNVKYNELVHKQCASHSIITSSIRIIAEEIVLQVTKCQEPAGRFLREDKESGLWYVVDNKDSVKRTVRLIRKELLTAMKPNTDGVQLLKDVTQKHKVDCDKQKSRKKR